MRMVEPEGAPAASPRERRAAVASDARTAARGSLASALLQVGGRAFTVTFVLAASRELLPDAFSRYSVLAAVVVVGLLLADFGTTATIARAVSRAPSSAKDVLGVAIPASAGLGVLVYAGLAGFAWTLYPRDLAIDVCIGALAVPLGSVSSSLLAALDGIGQIARHAVVTFLQTVVTAGFGLVLLAGGTGARGVAWALAAGGASALASSALSARQQQIWPKTFFWRPRQVRALLSLALPFAALGLISALSLRFDVLVLSLLSTERATATYDVALRAIEAVLSFNIVIAGPAVYLFSVRLGRRDTAGAQRAFDEAVRLSYLLGLPISTVVVVLHDPLARGIFGDAFAAAGPPLAILGAQVWLAFVAYVQGSLIIAGDFQRRGVLVAAAITAVVVVLDLALVPAFGAQGAASASLVTAVVTVFAFARFHRAHAGITTMVPPPGILLAALAAGVAAWLLRFQVLPAALLLSFLTYALALVVTRSVTASDVARLQAIIGRPPAA